MSSGLFMMFGNLSLPECVGNAAQHVTTCSLAVFNSTTSTILDKWNRFDQEKALQVLNDVTVVLNDARLRTRQLLQPKYRQQFHEEVFVQLLKRCLGVKRYNHEQIPLQTCRFEIHHNKDIQVENMLTAIVWTLLQDPTMAVDFHVLDDKMRSWNTRTDEQNLIRKIGFPSRWDIFEADEKTDAGRHRLTYEGADKGLSDSYSSYDQSTESLDELLKLADEAMSDVISARSSGGGDGKSSHQSSMYLSRENRDIITDKKKHGVLYAIRKLFKHEKNISTTKAENHTSAERDRNGREHNNVSDVGYNQHVTDIPTQPRDVNSNSKIGAAHADIKLANEKKMENEGLTIHIPSNVEKIVLIKDGRKITVEL